MRVNRCLALASLVVGVLTAAPGGDHRTAIAVAGQVPLSFERATSGNTRWMARGQGYRVAVSAADVELGLNNERLRILFVGADAKAPSAALDELPGKVNYLLGRDQKGWLRDIPTYGRVRYKGVYPGVDTVWYGRQGRLEFDLEIEPGADTSKIAMRFEGARKLAVEANGDLRVEMAGGSISLKQPDVYQDSTDGRKRIGGRYELRAGNEVGFHLAAFDKARPLIIDPTLVYATYFGSNTPTVQAVAVDATGNVYIGGYTSGGYLPTQNAFQAGIPGLQSAFVAKFDPTGKTVLYSTYIGGSGMDYLSGIAVDSTSGDLVGVGTTYSPDFPLVNAVQTANGDGFAFKLNAAGNALTYSTYLGGSVGFNGQPVALDPSGNAYVTGQSSGSVQATPGALNNCCTFVEKLSTTGGQVYAALIGGSTGNAIAVDALGAAYIAGQSTESSFPNNPPGARTTNAGGGGFVAKLSPDATSLVWATFVGGSISDYPNVIALGVGGVVYFGGHTWSPNLPVTSGAVQGTFGGVSDAFVASLSADGNSFGFVTYLGGGKYDYLISLAAGAGGLILAGNTLSHDFPITNAVQSTFPGSPYAFLRSTNSGVSFAPADSGLSASHNGAILPDPTSAGTIVLNTDAGAFRSADDGATWTSGFGYNIGSMARSLSNPSVLYEATGCYVAKSSDGGQTWYNNRTYSFSNCTSTNGIAVSPIDPNTVLLFSGNKEYRSTDGGQTLSSGITIPMSTDDTAKIVASPDGSLYAASPSFGLYKSTDVGLTWMKLGSGVLPANLSGFAFSAGNSSILYAADGTSVYRSTDIGASWSTIGPGTGVTYLAVDPSDPLHVYGSSAVGGILSSTDGGTTWTASGAILDSRSINDLSVSPLNPAELYVSSSVTQSGFVSKLSADGKTLLWSTFYGPYDNSYVGGATLSPSGDVWVAGYVGSGSLPLTPDARNANTYGSSPAFLARIADSTASCDYTISPATQYSYSAERLAFSVTAPSGCGWTATPSDSWIHLIRPTGTGSGTIPLTVDGNTTASTRTGTVSVNNQIYTIVQPSSNCTYQGVDFYAPSAGGTGIFTITAPTGCPWDFELQNSDPAAVTSGSTGTGNGSVTVSIPPNTGVDDLFYKFQFGGTNAGVLQLSGCTFSFPNGATIAIPGDAGQYSAQIEANLSGCAWDASSYDQTGWLALNNASSNGSGMLNYSVIANDTGVDRTAHVYFRLGNQPLTVTQDFTSTQFNDVPPSATYFDAANLMFQAGVTTGCIAGGTPQTRSYCPNDNVTREQMAAFIVRAVTGTTTPANYNPTPYFTDVPTTNLFFPHIQKMEELGITSGCATGLFCPTDNVPRWQMAIFMIRARLALYGATFTTATTPYFADVPTNVEGNGVPFPFIQRSYEEHVTAGCGTNPLVYCPEELVTRGQMASFIMRGLFNETTILGPTAPQVTGVSPNTMAVTVGTQITVTITGVNTNFQTGDTVTVPSGMLAVNNVVVNSATSISATLTANANVVAGPQALVVTTGGQNLTLPLAIQVGTY